MRGGVHVQADLTVLQVSVPGLLLRAQTLQLQFLGFNLPSLPLVRGFRALGELLLQLLNFPFLSAEGTFEVCTSLAR